MKFFTFIAVFVLVLLAMANALPLVPDPDVIINGDCINCEIYIGGRRRRGGRRGWGGWYDSCECCESDGIVDWVWTYG